MATLKGQNFRLLTYNSTSSKWSVVGMSTNCTITLGTSTDDSSTKDDIGMAARPAVVSKNWQVQVDSLSVADVGAMLTAIKSLTPFTLMWDEVSTSDNQTPESTAVARQGQAFLSDATFQFDDRTNSTKSLQFIGSGPISAGPSTPTIQEVSTGSFTKGQSVRLYLGSDNTTTPTSCIAAAKTLQLHVSLTVEDASTKDTTGDYVMNEPTALNYDISTSALMRSNDTITSAVGGKTVADLESIYEAGNPVKFQIANTSGANNRTKGSVIVSGSVILSQLTLQAQNRSNATYDAQLTGYGTYTVGA